MSGFKASEAAPKLDYDFNPHMDVKGTVPEPSQDAMRQYNKEIGVIYGGKTREEIAKLPVEDQEEIGAALVAAMAELCDGSPSLEELKALPFRTIQAFSGWLMGSFKNPTS